jgi:hypothetical protein
MEIEAFLEFLAQTEKDGFLAVTRGVTYMYFTHAGEDEMWTMMVRAETTGQLLATYVRLTDEGRAFTLRALERGRAHSWFRSAVLRADTPRAAVTAVNRACAHRWEEREWATCRNILLKSGGEGSGAYYLLGDSITRAAHVDDRSPFAEHEDGSVLENMASGAAVVGCWDELSDQDGTLHVADLLAARARQCDQLLPRA